MEKEKTYTTTDLMEITGLSRAAVLKRTSWGNYIKEFSFTESQVKAMGCDHDLRNEKKVVVVEKTNEEKLEELKKEHPLVTDEKCFTLSWFPETIPSVLKEEEE